MSRSWIVFLMLVSTLSIMAQGNKSKETKLKEEVEASQELILSKEQLTKANILDAPVDPTRYVVGAGDELVVSIVGQVGENFRTFVSPDGFVVLPSILPIDVRGLTLSQAKDRIKTSLKSIFTNADIAVTLLSLRFFRVHVSGSFEDLAYVRASASDRVSDILKSMGEIRGSRRNILLKRSNGSILRVDLVRRLHLGDLNADPYVLEGDVVHVPDLYSSFTVSGSVKAPGTYELVAGERLLDAIALSRGLTINADSSRIDLVRFTADTGRSITRITFDLRSIALSDTTANFRLFPDDRIFVRSKHLFHPQEMVTISGEVIRPGGYPIEDQRTKVSDVVRLAGGFTADAELGRIIVYRDRSYEGSDSEFDRLRKTPLTEMNDIEKAYFKARSRQEYPAVRTDFIKLFKDGSIDPKYDILLRNSDHIYIAKEKKTVTLVGGILRAGIYDLKPGWNYDDYVNAAGGFKDRAKKGDVTIIRDFGERWIDAKSDLEVEDGDVIFVPEREPIDGWQLTKDIFFVVGQLAAITSTAVLIYITATR